MKTPLVALALILAVTPACKNDKSANRQTETGSGSSSHEHIAISVTEDGFTPENIKVAAGKPVTLVFERTTDQTCAKQVVLQVDGKKIEEELPLNKPVEIEVTFAKAGDLTYACGMDMEHGTITVQ